MAADSLQGTTDYNCHVPAVKIVRKGSRVYGITGILGWFDVWIKWYEDGADPNITPICKYNDPPGEFLVFEDGKCFMFCLQLPYPEEQFAPFAFGSGRKYAIGAMLHGATAKEAVECAIIVDPSTGGPIEVIDLQSLKYCDHEWAAGVHPYNTEIIVKCLKCGADRDQAA